MPCMYLVFQGQNAQTLKIMHTLFLLLHVLVPLPPNHLGLHMWMVPKANMMMLSRTTYDDVFYTHQGWLTEDQKYLILNDELDEFDGSFSTTRTLLWNVEDLANPIHVGSHFADVESIDHNLYIQGNLAYLANYCSGLRILDSTQVCTNPYTIELYTHIQYCKFFID